MKKKYFIIGFLAIGVVALPIFGLGELLWIVNYHLAARGRVESVRLEQPPPCQNCNLLLISLDTVRADLMGFLGSTAGLTPNLDKIAEQSIVFTSAYSAAYFTTPSHMTVFTSLFPTTHQVESRNVSFPDKIKEARNLQKKVFRLKTENTANALNTRYQTLAEVLAAANFRAEWHGSSRTRFFDFRDGFGRGFHSNQGSPFFRGLELAHFANKGFDLKSLGGLLGNQRAFLFFHTYAAHSPYFFRGADRKSPQALIPYDRTLLESVRLRVTERPELLANQSDRATLSKQEESDIIHHCTTYTDMRPCFSRHLTLDGFWHGVGAWQQYFAYKTLLGVDEETFAHELPLLTDAYEDGLRDLDLQVGQLWRELERTGALRNTLVVFFSDHGEEIYDHGQLGHWNFYEHTARVPVIVYHPLMRRNIRSDSLFSLVDMMPMILSILNIDSPKQVQGHVPWVSQNKYVFGATLGSSYVRDQDWKFMRDFEGEEELYYLPLDPMEKVNLIEYKNIWVKQALSRLQQAQRDWMLSQSLD